MNNTLRLEHVHGQNHFGIAVDDDVWVVSGNNNLTIPFAVPNLLNDQVVDEVVIQVVFWLIQDD